MSQLRLAADRPKKNERDRDDAKCVQPIERPPIGISNFKQTDGKEQQERDHGDTDRHYLFSAFYFLLFTFRSLRWPVFPPQPEKHDCEKWNEPAVAVLVVDRPFAT